MKTLFTLLLATIFTTSASAYDEGRLTVTLASGHDIRVVINNRTYRLEENTVTLDAIRPGQQTIQIYRERNKAYDRNNPGRGRFNDLIYSSTVYVRPNHHVDIMVNRFGKALIDERQLGMDDNRRYDPDRDSRNDRYRQDDYNNRYAQAMDDRDFDRLIERIQNAWFGKMTTAKNELSRNYFTTRQVRQVLMLFASESEKLELAKLAYRNTVDQRNYYRLYDVFSFQSSKDELDQYIRNNRW